MNAEVSARLEELVEVSRRHAFGAASDAELAQAAIEYSHAFEASREQERRSE